MNIGNVELDVPCPSCGFYNPIYIYQVRLRDVVICRGCKSNIQLEDHMNEARKAERAINAELDKLLSLPS